MYESLARAARQRADGDLEGAAATLDRAARLDRARALAPLQELLDALAVVEHGVAFRYVPAGSFTMGSDDGEPDEAPPHEVTLPGFWLSETPITWAEVTRALGWPPPPGVADAEALERLRREVRPPDPKRFSFGFRNNLKICLQYCEDRTTRARDWHAHDAHGRWRSQGRVVSSQELFGVPERTADGPYRYAQKPIVALDWEVAAACGRALEVDVIAYRLPTEAEWERAARGCFPAARYPWGDAPPTAERADFDRFKEFSILPSRGLPPNDYGLYAMAGGVWEWCEDDYDARFYARSPARAPVCRLPEDAPRREHVIRGGSWADCEDVLRVSFRASSTGGSTPNIGFRLVRVPADR
ncbi:MAG: SUMF1/EgtB/PvdO family nonheme iron enzyme [Myxococcales bacterium]|nr:SUMF1/EgtB/PvdO family nonheme iron enzyme [Myxococcales bacterium]